MSSRMRDRAGKWMMSLCGGDDDMAVEYRKLTEADLDIFMEMRMKRYVVC